MIRLVVLSGMSGSGKTLALRCLEDLGYFAVDNLPVALIDPFVKLLDRGDGEDPRGAFVVDVREKTHLEVMPQVLAELRRDERINLSVLYLEADEQTLIRRYSESRRPHPLARSGISIAEAISEERRLLERLRNDSDRVIATDAFNSHELRATVKEMMTAEGDGGRASLQCQIVSFGFKYGTPRDVDTILDVRFLSNPYFENDLRLLDGRDERVADFLSRNTDFDEFVGRIEELLSFLMPRYVAEGKSYFTLAVGCSGGRHRSVATAEHLARFLAQSGFPATTVHRDLQREGERIKG